MRLRMCTGMNNPNDVQTSPAKNTSDSNPVTENAKPTMYKPATNRSREITKEMMFTRRS